MGDNLWIHPKQASGLGAVVEIHGKSFLGFFCPFLGHDFMALLSKSMHRYPEGIALVGFSFWKDWRFCDWDGKRESEIAAIID